MLEGHHLVLGPINNKMNTTMFGKSLSIFIQCPSTFNSQTRLASTPMESWRLSYKEQNAHKNNNTSGDKVIA